MDISTETLQSFLDDAWDAAPAEANTLRDTLRGYEKAATRLFSAGSLASVGKNSANQAYRGPGVGSYTPVQIANAWRTLITLFDRVKRAIDRELAEPVPADPDAPVNDADLTVYTCMMANLQVVTEYQSDITELLLPPTLTPPMPMSQ